MSRRAIATSSAALLLELVSGRKAGSLEFKSPPAPPELVELEIATQGDLLEFSKKELACLAKSRVRLSFSNKAKYVHFDHNWVLIRPGFYDALIASAERKGDEQDWSPKIDPGIIAATKTAHAGETVSVEFEAPEAGKYVYICTFPGHTASMWGVLIVTEN